MFEGYDDLYDEAARLAILRCLAEQTDYRLSDSMIDDLLATRFAINRGRAYVRTQLAWIENSTKAIKTENTGTSILVELTSAGEDHMMRRQTLPGIKRPGPKTY